MIAVIGGPAVYLVAQTALRLRVTRTLSRPLISGALACAAIGLVGGAWPGMIVSALLVTVLVLVALVEEANQLKGFLLEPDRCGRQRRPVVLQLAESKPDT